MRKEFYSSQNPVYKFLQLPDVKLVPNQLKLIKVGKISFNKIISSSSGTNWASPALFYPGKLRMFSRGFFMVSTDSIIMQMELQCL